MTLARKVETELFRPPDVPKRKINVNVVGGVVELSGRGRLTADDRRPRWARASIQGVRDVESFLRVP